MAASKSAGHPMVQYGGCELLGLANTAITQSYMNVWLFLWGGVRLSWHCPHPCFWPCSCPCPWPCPCPRPAPTMCEAHATGPHPQYATQMRPTRTRDMLNKYGRPAAAICATHATAPLPALTRTNTTRPHLSDRRYCCTHMLGGVCPSHAGTTPGFAQMPP